MKTEKTLRTRILEKMVVMPFIFLFITMIATFLSAVIGYDGWCNVMGIVLMVNTISVFGVYFLSRVVDSPVFCHAMGWHKEPQYQGFDGCSMNGNCPACGKEVMQDSQGNWF